MLALIVILVSYREKNSENLWYFIHSFIYSFIHSFVLAAAQVSEKPWYKTVWFLALCALAGLLIIFLLVVCCCRGYGKNRTVYVRQREPLPTKNKIGTRGGGVAMDDEFSNFPPNLKMSQTNLNDPVRLFTHLHYFQMLDHWSALEGKAIGFENAENNLTFFSLSSRKPFTMTV